MAILKIRDADGNVHEIPVIKGDKGDKGDPAKEEWIDIADFTTTAEVKQIRLNTDINGNGFNCKRIIAKIELPNNITSNNFNIGHYIRNIGEAVGGVYVIWNVNHAHFTVDFEVLKDKLFIFRISKGALKNDHFTNIGSVSTEWLRYMPEFTANSFIEFELYGNSDDAIFPVGTQIKVWGLKA